MTDLNQVVNRLLDQIALDLEKRWGTSLIGTVIEMPDESIKTLGLELKLQGPVSRERLEEVLSSGASFMLSEIKKNTFLTPYLINSTFNYENIEFSIFVTGQKGEAIYHPDIGIASLSEGKIKFRTIERGSPFQTRIPEKLG
jgi:hypothetical protein